MGMVEHESAAVHEFAQEIRSNLALVLAVTSLRDQTICKQLIAMDDLNWKKSWVKYCGLSLVLRT